MKRKKILKVIAMTLAASLMFSGCASEEDSKEEEKTIEVENSSDEAEKEREIPTPEENKKYYKDLSEYGVYDESNMIGITYNNPLNGEAKDYIFKKVATYPMSSEEYGTVEDFKGQAKSVINGLLTDEMLDNCDILMVINVYESPLDADVELKEMRIMYEFEVAGVRKFITIIENQFKNAKDNTYIINRNLNIMGEIMDIGVFTQGDIVESKSFDKSLIEFFEVPRGIYTIEDLALLLDKKSQAKEKELTITNNE